MSGHILSRSVMFLYLGMLAGCWSYLMPGSVETGTSWAPVGDYPELHQLGYDFVITSVTADRADWVRTFDAAQAAGLKLIVGMYPPPYRLRHGEWVITRKGIKFLRYAASRAGLVKAIFVFNEPYWINPRTGRSHLCGALSARQLRELRQTIRGVWPEALIYQDLGEPRSWAPGGAQQRDYACVGKRYADQKGVADFVGIWNYPFDSRGYHKSKGLAELNEEIDFVRNQMEAEPIVLAQSFGCAGCSPPAAMPSAEQIRDWNCSVRALGPYALSWYVWQQSSYDDYLVNHPESWEATTAAACAPDKAKGGEE